MPAASERGAGGAPPVTFRPLGVRFAVIVFGLLLVAVVAVIWVAFPASVREDFTTFQRLTVVAFGVAAGAAGYALARCRVEARPEGLVVVNGYSRRRYAWEDVAGVTLRAGGPWAILELTDGTTTPAMGIQGSDGSRAVAQVRALRRILAARHGSDGDPRP
jgi:hypothetical protein